MAGPGTRHQGVASTRPAPPRREPALGPAVRISYDEPAPAGRAIKGLLGLIVVGMIVMALGDRILAWRRPAGQGPAMQGRSVDAGARNRDNFPAAPAGGAEGQALELRQLDAPRLPAPVDTPAAELPAAERPGAGDRLPRLSEAIQACEGKGFGAPCGVSGRNNEILSGKCAPLPPGVGSAAAATRPGVDGQSLVCRPERFAAGSGDPSRRPGGPRPPIGGTQ